MVKNEGNTTSAPLLLGNYVLNSGKIAQTRIIWWFQWCQILDTPSLLAEGSRGVKKNIFKERLPQSDAAASSCCWFWSHLHFLAFQISNSWCWFLTKLFDNYLPFFCYICIWHELQIACKMAKCDSAFSVFSKIISM